MLFDHAHLVFLPLGKLLFLLLEDTLNMHAVTTLAIQFINGLIGLEGKLLDVMVHCIDLHEQGLNIEALVHHVL